MAISLWTLPILPVILYLTTLFLAPTFPTLRNKRILLLIAHPDDEAMFFSPTVQHLTSPSLGNHLKILCLSTGDADGLGPVRSKELVRSARLLGLRSDADVLVMNDTRFPDSMTQAWDAEAIAGLLRETFVKGNGKGASKDRALETGIDVLLTFDRGGVSGHTNHVSLYHGARAFVASLAKGRSGWEDPVKLYVLTSTNVVRKYASLVDVPVTVLLGMLGRGKADVEHPDPLLVVARPDGYRRGQKAMTDAHESQMRWFRWGWIGVSRYMVVNDLRREKVR